MHTFRFPNGHPNSFLLPNEAERFLLMLMSLLTCPWSANQDMIHRACICPAQSHFSQASDPWTIWIKQWPFLIIFLSGKTQPTLSPATQAFLDEAGTGGKWAGVQQPGSISKSSRLCWASLDKRLSLLICNMGVRRLLGLPWAAWTGGPGGCSL